MRRFSFSLFCDDLYRGIGCTGPVLNDGPGAAASCRGQDAQPVVQPNWYIVATSYKKLTMGTQFQKKAIKLWPSL